MKINGTIMVSPLMFQMEIGEERFLHSSATILTENKLFIDTRYGVSITKNYEKNYIFPIKRTGPGIEDFEIDFNVAFFLYNQKLTEKEMEAIQKEPYIIGPYEIKTEIYQPLQYREQTYPRMDLDELIESFAVINQHLEDLPDNTKYLGDKRVLRELIKEKLTKLSKSGLIIHLKEFKPLTEEESDNGNYVNYYADKEIESFIINLIESSEAEVVELEKLSKGDLEIEMNKASDKGDFARAAKIRDFIKANR